MPITRTMKSWACAFALLVVLGAACSRPPMRMGLPSTGAAPKLFVTVRIREEGNAVRRVALEDYVAGSIISEVAPPTGDEAVIQKILEVQAVVARTYAVANRGRHRAQGFDLCSTTHCQLYEPSRLKTSRWAASGRVAAARTAGAILWHKEGPARALFHADCGGHTSAAAHVWGGAARPYLAAHADDDVEGVVHASWHYEVSVAEFLKALNGDARTRVGKRIDAVMVIDRDVAGRADTIALNGEQERLVRGEDLRALLSRAFGPRSIRSTMFSVHRDGGTLIFDGRGYGHGVGLCQAGALARIRAGASPEAVLLRYFPQTSVRTLSN
jgi:stage II sporulation protein D